MQLKVDSGLCQGHGRCYTLFPKLFSADDEGYASPTDAELEGQAVADARDAVDVCPECAISLIGDVS